MDVLETSELSKKVRTYDGQLPHLKVAVQAIAGLVVNPITDLQVQKAGISIRHLSVNKIGTTMPPGFTRFSDIGKSNEKNTKMQLK